VSVTWVTSASVRCETSKSRRESAPVDVLMLPRRWRFDEQPGGGGCGPPREIDARLGCFRCIFVRAMSISWSPLARNLSHARSVESLDSASFDVSRSCPFSDGPTTLVLPLP